jgi:hypothetical protein
MRAADAVLDKLRTRSRGTFGVTGRYGGLR